MADVNRKESFGNQDLGGSRATGSTTGTTGATGTTMGDWNTEEQWWRDNWSKRPYAKADRGYEFYRPAYRYGFESANRYQGRRWHEVEADVRSGWDKFEHRSKSTWEDIKDAVRDVWDHVTGKEHVGHSRR